MCRRENGPNAKTLRVCWIYYGDIPMEEIENDLSTYSFKRVIVLLLMLSDDKIILVQTQTKYCDMFLQGRFISYIWVLAAMGYSLLYKLLT